MVKTQGLGGSYITAVRSLPSKGGKTNPAAGAIFEVFPQLFQSASGFLDCQGLSRQGLDGAFLGTLLCSLEMLAV